MAKARAEVDLVIRQAGERPPTRPACRACRPRSSSCSAGSSTARATARTCSTTSSRRAAWPRSSRPRSAPTSRSPRWAACSTTSARPSTTRSRGRTPPSAPRSPSATTCRSRWSTAIAAHHQEVEYACLEAPIVQVADAISASRPGARGESMDTYVKRLEDLQAIAESFGGVEKLVRGPGRPRGPHPRPARGDRRPDRDAARPRHRQEDRGAADLPGPDQGHGHPRDARRRVREVAALTRPGASAGPDSGNAAQRRCPAPARRLPGAHDRRPDREARPAGASSSCCRGCARRAASTS